MNLPSRGQKVTVKSSSFAEHMANPSRRGDGCLKRVSRHRRLSASPVFESVRCVVRKGGASVTSGTPAFEFVALSDPRLSSVQRTPVNVLRSVALRTVVLAYPNSPRNTLQGVLAKWRRTARRKKFARISERFADNTGWDERRGDGRAEAAPSRVSVPAASPSGKCN